MKNIFSNKVAIFWFMLPAIIFFLLIIILPVILSGYYSTLDWNGFGVGEFIGLDNFKELFIKNMDGFPRAVKNSFLFLLVSVFIQIPISLLLALVLGNGIRGEGFYRTVFFIPVILATVVIGQLWMKIYNPDYGLLNAFLKAVGLEEWTRAWLGETETALGASFIPIIWQYVGYHMLLLYAAIKTVSTDIYEAARVDGASSFKIATKITIPLIIPMLKVSAIFAVTGSLKIFDLVYVLTGGGPAGSSEVPSTLMVRSIFKSYRYGYGSAMAVFIIIECLLFTGIVKYIFSKLEKKY